MVIFTVHQKVAAAATDITAAKISTSIAVAAVAATRNVPETIVAMVIEAPKNNGTTRIFLYEFSSLHLMNRFFVSFSQ